MTSYSYERRFRINVHDSIGADGMPQAEVVQGGEFVHRGSPYQCLCWLAWLGDRRAKAQLKLWHDAQEARQKADKDKIAKRMGMKP